MVLQRKRLSIVNYGEYINEKTEDCSHWTQSNPIHGWIQSMSNSVLHHQQMLSLRAIRCTIAVSFVSDLFACLY